MGAHISDIEYYLPQQVLTNNDLSDQFSDWSADKVEQKTGIRERHIAAVDETACDLGFIAADRLLRRFERDKIDFLIFCTQSPDYFLPTTACVLHARLGLRTDTGALDYNLGCSGFVYGLAIAKGLIASQIASHVLLITAETYSKFLYSKDRSTRTIFGDGAAATIISRSHNDDIGRFVLGTEGKGAYNLIVKNGAFRSHYDPDAREQVIGGTCVTTDNCLFMNGPEIFNFTIESIPRVFQEVLRINDCTLETVQFVVFHQANKFMLEYLRSKLSIAPEKFYNNMLYTGNTVSATIPLALRDCADQHIIAEGDRILLLGFGVGYSWAGTIITWSLSK